MSAVSDAASAPAQPALIEPELIDPGLAPADAGPVARLRAARVPIGAFLASRLLVLVTGMIGVATMTKHAGLNIVDQARSLGSVGYLLSGSTFRFDSGYYVSVAAHGYGTLQSGKIAFFPVYPVLIRLVSLVTFSPVVAGVLVSAIAFAAALLMLHRLTELELGRRAADTTILLLCFAPLSFFFTAIYSESIFLALTIGGLYAARTGRWRLACALAAAATLTRPTGIALVGPLLVMRWRTRPAAVSLRSRWAGDSLWIAAAPLALLAWLVTLAALGYGLTGEFHVEHTLWHRMTMLPLETLVISIFGIFRGLAWIVGGHTVFSPGQTGPFPPMVQDVILGGVLIATLVALDGCRRWMRPEYPVYAGLMILMCLTTPESGEPLWSYDRFALTMFPLWMVGGAWLARRRRTVQVGVLLTGAAALVFYTLQFSSWAFVA
jgi:hypothetical protein